MTVKPYFKRPRNVAAAIALACLYSNAPVARASDDAVAGVPDNTLRLGLYFVHYATNASDISGPLLRRPVST